MAEWRIGSGGWNERLEGPELQCTTAQLRRNLTNKLQNSKLSCLSRVATCCCCNPPMNDCRHSWFCPDNFEESCEGQDVTWQCQASSLQPWVSRCLTLQVNGGLNPISPLPLSGTSVTSVP